MNQQNLTATIDIELIQKKVNEMATEGALKAVKEYYTGYNSPYVKQVEEALAGIAIPHTLELPDVIGMINTSLSAEIDNIANTAVAKTFIPIVKRFLRRADAEMKFSDILKAIIEENYEKSPDEYSCRTELSNHGWLEVKITTPDGEYEITLHEVYKDKEKRQVLSLPRMTGKSYRQTMKLEVEGGAKLELPFTHDLLKDKVVSYFANLMLSETKITMDVDDFENDMFPEQCYCH